MLLCGPSDSKLKDINYHSSVTRFCQEIQKSYDRTLGLENQSCLSKFEPRARLEITFLELKNRGLKMGIEK